ncbi:hypothetical protein [Pectobacterium odoriferum]|nr:hypothetical protein [Pectobacterium odoriferum]
MSAPSSPENKTALINQIKRLGLEYGIAILEATHKVTACMPDDLGYAEK